MTTTKIPVVVAILLSAAAFSKAATVTFTSGHFSQTGSDYSLLDNSGTILAAVNFSTNPVRSGTYSSTNPDPNVSLNGISFAPTAYTVTSGTYYQTNATGIDTDRTSGTSYSSSSSLYGLAYDVARTGSNDTNLTLNLQNLTIGNTYQVQFIFPRTIRREMSVLPPEISRRASAGARREREPMARRIT